MALSQTLRDNCDLREHYSENKQPLVPQDPFLTNPNTHTKLSRLHRMGFAWKDISVTMQHEAEVILLPAKNKTECVRAEYELFRATEHL